MAAPGSNNHKPDRNTRMILKEFRELRIELRGDRRQAAQDRRQAAEDRRQAADDRRRSDEERRQADEQRRAADEAWREERRLADEQRRLADEQRRLADEAWRAEWRETLQRSDERFQETMRDFREDSVRREAALQKSLDDIRVVGVAIVRTLNLHTRLLRGIDRKLGALGPWRPGSADGHGV
jgi:hypothetical protein